MARVLVIGGVAAGATAAVQAKRRRPDLEVVLLERGGHVSYGSCGIPYNLQDPARPIEALAVVSVEALRRERGVDVRLGHEAVAIDPARRVVTVHQAGPGRTEELSYDGLILATGAAAVRPPWPGSDDPAVFTVRTLADGGALKRFLAEGRPSRAVVIGAGYIGMELAETLVVRGLEVTVLERAEGPVPGFAPPIAGVVAETLSRHGVELRTGVSVERIRRRGSELLVETDHGTVAGDLVVVAVGIRPEVGLARSAGIPLGATGAIAVDDRMRTALPGIWAAGDCVEVRHRVTGQPVWIPLGTTANKTGKVAGANAAGADERFGGIVGTAGFRLFELEVARTGLSHAEARAAGFDAAEVPSSHRSRGHGQAGAATLTTVVVAERGTGRLLGAQTAGADTVAKRIDVFATALHAGFGLDEVAALDLSYAPPFAPVWDPVLVAAEVARKNLQRDP